MRQAILVVVLVSASFLGGAFVNGPALSWAQTRVLRSLGLSDTGEIASVDLKATAIGEMGSDGSAPTKPDSEPMREPVAPVPSLIAEGESPQQDASRRRSIPKPGPKSGSSVTAGGSPRSRASSLPSLASAVAPLASPSSAQTAPLDASITPAAGVSQPESPREPPVASSPLDRNLAPAVLDSLAALLPTSPARSAESSSASNAPKSVVDGGDDWVVLQRRMQTLGVSRFNIEGQPGGRVVFSCLIPLAGRQAVAQRFEAEGDDVVSAAQATLRRVALWRATQPQSP